MLAVITGSSGFIGGHLANRLHGAGYEVVGIDRHATPGGWEYPIDLADPMYRRRISELIEPADVVYHLAARPGVRDTATDIEAHRHRDNVVATANVLEATPLTCPVVMTSSSSVYGSAMGTPDGFRPCHEDDPLNPRGGYARSKVRAEELCHRRAERGGRVTVVRPFTVAGEGQRPDMALSIWIKAVASGEPIRLFGSPNRTRDITDVRDVVDGLVAIYESSFDGTLNLGTGQGHRIVDMARTVLDAMGRPARLEVIPGSREEVEATLADTTRCRDVVGFVPSTDLPSLVERMLADISSADRLARVR